jgi:NADPH:quinone reductase-like Zn-dependent oxidoreductase
MRDISIKSVKSTSRNQLMDSLQLVRQGLVKPVISDVLPLEKAAIAHEAVESGRAFGRVLLKPSLSV